MHFKILIQTIKERREMLQVTQETLAELSGVGLRSSSLKVVGNPTAETLQKLGDALGLNYVSK
jgi:transcriptional regulator with XRE-family HTH domain